MTFARLALIPVAALGLAAPAMAGGLDTPVVEAPVTPVAPLAPVPVSTGSDWTGGYLGGSLSYGDLSASSTFGDEFNGGGLGLHAGYNYDLGSVVLGGEIEFTGYDITDDATGQDLDSVIRAKVRAGYDAGAFLPYITAGWAQATTSGALGDLESDGVLYGIGVDYQVTDVVTVGAEALRHEFDDFDSTGIDLDADTFALRVSYDF